MQVKTENHAQLEKVAALFVKNEENHAKEMKEIRNETTNELKEMRKEILESHLKLVGDVAGRLQNMDNKNQYLHTSMTELVAVVNTMAKQVGDQNQKLNENCEDVQTLQQDTNKAIGVIFERMQQINGMLASGGATHPPVSQNDEQIEKLAIENLQLRSIVQATRTEMQLLRKKVEEGEKRKKLCMQCPPAGPQLRVAKKQPPLKKKEQVWETHLPRGGGRGGPVHCFWWGV